MNETGAKIQEIFEKYNDDQARTFAKALEGLHLVNPAHIELESSGYGEYPDGYQITKQGIEKIVEVFRESCRTPA